MQNEELTLEEVLESGFDSEVEEEESRENLSWGILSRSFLVITG